MLYLIAHFQKISKGVTPWTPRFTVGRSWEANQVEKWRVGEGNQVSDNFIHPWALVNIVLKLFGSSAYFEVFTVCNVQIWLFSKGVKNFPS